MNGQTAKLETTDSKDKREELKNKAVEMRENGSYEESISLFDQILDWDRANSNLKGLVDVLGHKRISLSLLSDKSDTVEKSNLINEALKCIEESLKIVQSNPSVFNKGSEALQKIHLAATKLRLSDLTGNEEELKDALKLVEEGIRDLPGTEAHKAWPLNVKAEIQMQFKNYDEALETLLEAQKTLYNGYEEERNLSDQSELKLAVWNASTCLNLARLYKLSGRVALARIYAQAVIDTDDSVSLKPKKDQAREVLKSLS